MPPLKSIQHILYNNCMNSVINLYQFLIFKLYKLITTHVFERKLINCYNNQTIRNQIYKGKNKRPGFGLVFDGLVDFGFTAYQPSSSSSCRAASSDIPDPLSPLHRFM